MNSLRGPRRERRKFCGIARGRGNVDIPSSLQYNAKHSGINCRRKAQRRKEIIGGKLPIRSPQRGWGSIKRRSCKKLSKKRQTAPRKGTAETFRISPHNLRVPTPSPRREWGILQGEPAPP